MENLSMCRICLATDVRLCSIASHLQDMYERISSITFKREDCRPLVACYICHARLLNCYRLRTSCLRNEQLLTEMMSSGVLKPQDGWSTNSFRVMSVINISIGCELQESTECHIKEEALEVTCDAEFDLQCNTNDMMREELCEQIDDNNQYSHVEDPLDVIKREPDDVETDAEDIKVEIEDIVEKNKPNIAGPSSQSADNISPMNVKVVLERIDVNDTRTGIPVLKKLVETGSHSVTENKNIVNNIRETNDKVGGKLHKHEDNEVLAHYEVCKQTSKSNLSSINECSRTKVHLERRSCTRTDEKQFQCDVCNRYFRHKQNLMQHMYIHTGVKRFQCEICNKYFRSGTNLTRHMYIHTGEKRFQCDVCKKCMTSKYNLTQHISTHADEKQFRCDVCNKCFKSQQHLTHHMYRHTDEKRFQCDVCNKCLTSKQNLKQHMYTHTDEIRFRCNICEKFFRSRSNLATHMYTHTGEKRLQCEVCNKYISSKYNLSKHMATHTDEKRFRCDVCNKCFKYKQHLTRHMYTH